MTQKVTNAAPVFVDSAAGAPRVQFSVGEDGFVSQATVSGAFDDKGNNDLHLVSIYWGDGVAMEDIPLVQGDRSFSITRLVGLGANLTADAMYPVVIEIHDDDGGVDGQTLGGTLCGCEDTEDEETSGGSLLVLSDAWSNESALGAPQQQPGAAVTTFNYLQAPSQANLHVSGFDFSWIMGFNQAAIGLVGYQKVEYTLDGFDNSGRLVHQAKLLAIDLIPMTGEASFNDRQFQDALNALAYLWFANDGVCRFDLRARGDFRLVPANGILVASATGARNYQPATDRFGMVLAITTVDGAVFASTSLTGPPGGGGLIQGLPLWDVVLFTGTATYRAVWHQHVSTTAKRNLIGDPNFTIRGYLNWPQQTSGAAGAVGLPTFPEKPTFDGPTPWIDVRAKVTRSDL
jgi:hypothetical protein